MEKAKLKKKIVLGVFIGIIIISVYFLIRYINYKTHYVSSDAVFVKSDSLTNLSFKLPGKIEKIYINEGDNVKKGEILAKLDTKDLEIKKNELIKNINSLDEKIKATVIQKDKLTLDVSHNISLTQEKIKKLNNLIKAKEYEIKAKEIKLSKLKNDYERFKRLFNQKRISKEKYENIKTSYFAFLNEINANKEQLKSMYNDLNMLKIQLKIAINNTKEIKRLSKIIASLMFQKKALKEKLALINQNIKDSFIYAPFTGTVAKKFANADEVVAAGKLILSEVNLKDLYVLDLLEEKKLKRIKPGCKAVIHIDALDKDFDGVVSKILPASASTFAILPRDISSGEFTKLQQRFYVRIKFKEVPKDVKVGMGGEIKIQKCKVKN